MYVNKSLLSLNGNADFRLRENNIQIPTAEVRCYGDRHLHVADRLGPFVRQLGLFGGFAGFAGGFFLVAAGELGGGGGLFVGHFAVVAVVVSVVKGLY